MCPVKVSIQERASVTKTGSLCASTLGRRNASEHGQRTARSITILPVLSLSPMDVTYFSIAVSQAAYPEPAEPSMLRTILCESGAKDCNNALVERCPFPFQDQGRISCFEAEECGMSAR